MAGPPHNSFTLFCMTATGIKAITSRLTDYSDYSPD